MPAQISQSQIATLTPKERLALIEVLWESMAEAEKQWPLSPAQRKLVQERIEDHRKNPREGEDYRTVLARLRGKRGGRQEPEAPARIAAGHPACASVPAHTQPWAISENRPFVVRCL